ncbi:isomerase [Tamilnaduibacter salinus]|uniref:Isomerase n=1 Tax=Tamilnaduibacter salinus TaxID=1484056 RepID=A0A2A2HZT6_9GAMM|nr:PhzF family phenazine biosynthesis protein [Tamilnaduibacter salinus]PAV24949.1 isomerase [Tamilnaduibacter salinus]
MPTVRLYQVDAFSAQLFSGNPAAVVPLEGWLDDAVLQAIAAENNVSETAFLVPSSVRDADFELRWMTPAAEVPLCGHATLATAWVLFNRLGWEADQVRFHSRSGPLGVTRRADGWLEMDFPNLGFESVETPDLIREAFGVVPDRAFFVPNDTNYMLVLDSEADVRQADPDLRSLKALGNQGVIVTATGDEADFVSRYFAPGVDVDEDPVTGSIHSVLTPYWAERQGRSALDARQLSSRGGRLQCELRGDRVAIAGQCAFYMAGEIALPD